MSRKRRSYKRYYKKGRWSANIASISNDLTLDTAGPFYTSILLAQNPLQTSQTVSQQYTVKNIELNATVESEGFNVTDPWIEELTIFIMYVPQGMNITANYAYEHPEYIMAYRYIGTPQVDNNPNYIIPKIKTRLSRRLQTGDAIVAILTGVYEPDTDSRSSEASIRGLVRWWTKAN